jgi:hypothetical protein
VAAVLLLPTAGAEAATYCVATSSPGCIERATVAAAFTSAATESPDADRIEIGPVDEAGTFADATGQPVEAVGAGVTRLAGTLRLTEPQSSVRTLRVGDLDLAGSAERVLVEGVLRGLAGSPRVEGSTVAGDLLALGDVTARHVTVLGGARTPGGGALTLRSAIVDGGADPDVNATWSNVPLAGEGNVDSDPQFVAAGDARLRAGSPMIDAGDPAPLAASEPAEDQAGYVRVVDGRGSGTARRDMGAHEYQPPPVPLPAGNLLANPGAELDTAAWQAVGAFRTEEYGTVDTGASFPSRLAGEALGGGARFFAGGPASAEASASQAVDVRTAAPEIDGGLERMRLSALLGGYGADGDAAEVEAAFLGPAGEPLQAFTIGPVEPLQRGHATNLAPRSATASIPALTRTIRVTVRGRWASGLYNDAYVDNVGLELLPGPRRPGPASVTGRRRLPFAGVSVLSSVARLDRKGRAWVRLGCASRTVGRCSGRVTLAALPTGGRATPIGGRQVGLAPGRRRRVAIRISTAARRRVRARGRLRARLHTAMRDGQGEVRTTIAPLTIKPGRRRR